MFDVIVLGIGGIGSSAVHQLAKSGYKVLGLDQHHPPHKFGSSHGESRIIRHAYFEGYQYIPLIDRSYELWREIEIAASTSLLQKAGGLSLGKSSGQVVQGCLNTATQFDLDIIQLDADQIRKKFPQFNIDNDTSGFYEEGAHILNPELCIQAQLDLALQYSAKLNFNEQVIHLSGLGTKRGIKITTSKNEYACEKIVICAGAWSANFLQNGYLPLQVKRRPVFWFKPSSDIKNFTSPDFPLYVWEIDHDYTIYGFPHISKNSLEVKFSFHDLPGQICDADSVSRTVSREEIELALSFVKKYIPDLAGEVLKTEVCLYTYSPDENFYLGYHPQDARVAIATGFSGHGFKFCPAIGEIITKLIKGETSNFDLSLFSTHRFSK